MKNEIFHRIQILKKNRKILKKLKKNDILNGKINIIDRTNDICEKIWWILDENEEIGRNRPDL